MPRGSGGIAREYRWLADPRLPGASASLLFVKDQSTSETGCRGLPPTNPLPVLDNHPVQLPRPTLAGGTRTLPGPILARRFRSVGRISHSGRFRWLGFPFPVGHPPFGVTGKPLHFSIYLSLIANHSVSYVVNTTTIRDIYSMAIVG